MTQRVACPLLSCAGFTAQSFVASQPCLMCPGVKMGYDITLIEAAVRRHIYSVDKLLNKLPQALLLFLLCPPPLSPSSPSFPCSLYSLFPTLVFVCVPSERPALTVIPWGDLSLRMAGQPYLYYSSRRHCCFSALLGVLGQDLSLISLSFSLYMSFFLSLHLWLSSSLFLSLNVFPPLSLPSLLLFFLYICLSLSLFLSTCLSLCLSLFLSLPCLPGLISLSGCVQTRTAIYNTTWLWGV